MAQESSSLSIKFKKNDRTFLPNEKIEGVVVVSAYKGWSHKGIRLLAEGKVHLSTQSRGILSRGDSNGRTIDLFRHETEAVAAGSFPHGVFEIPFEFTLKALPNAQIYETYHGINVSVIYAISLDCERGMTKKDLFYDVEFLVQNPPPSKSPADSSNPKNFDLSPETLENVDLALLAQLPKFKVVGRLHKSTFSLNQPLTGELTIQSTSVAIKSIELQLVRVESVASLGQFNKELTEIQNIQICDNNPPIDMLIPMYCVFPRLFTCPTLTSHAEFKIEFELNAIIVFSDGYVVTENFPLTLVR